jgi:indole-3-glycerol phosphate synthase/phosphoribosylanthranilate isomerase
MSVANVSFSSVVAPSDSNILAAAAAADHGVQQNKNAHPYPMELQKQALNSLLNDSENADFDARHILGYTDGDSHTLSKLQEITATRILDYQNHVMNNSNSNSNCPSLAQLEQQAMVFRNEHGPVLNLQDVIQAQAPRMALAAEFKRASPSKGQLTVDGKMMQAGQQACLYTQAGANIVSIITEPHWFQGSLQDMREARLETAALVVQQQQTNQDDKKQLWQRQRPAILRKCFITNEYMIAEAAAHGADTILLIVAVLPQHLLQRLIHYARTTLHMEPLVEVHAPDELQVALQAGARVIGVNNRNLHTFQVDLETTRRTARAMTEQGYTFHHDQCDHQENEKVGGRGNKPEYTICALSGMSTAQDVHLNRRAGVGMCLIGESLMRAIDPVGAIQSLCLDPNDYYRLYSDSNGNVDKKNASGGEDASTAAACTGAAYTAGSKIIKICGITTPDDALQACRAGANLIGIIFAKKSKREIASPEHARGIVDAVRKFGERQGRVDIGSSSQFSSSSSSISPRAHLEYCSRMLAQVATSRCPLVVGVFQNQDMAYICEMVETCGLDLVQLHGQEGFAAASQCSVPAIRVVDIPVDNDSSGGDSGSESNDKAVQQILEQLTCDPIAILLDTAIKGQHGGGGTSTVFDWTIARKIQNAGVPVMLAGGLTPANIQNCIVQIQPFGVDVSSGVEESPGVKNHAAISSFITTARRAAQKAQEGF